MLILINDGKRDDKIRAISEYRYEKESYHTWFWIKTIGENLVIQIKPVHRICRVGEPIILNDDGSYYMNLEYLEPYKKD